MGDKYIIELEEKPFHKENGDFLYRVKGFASLVFDLRGLKRLKPYSRPDIEAIRMEAYAEGYKTAKVQCNIQAENDLREVGERRYQKGLSDAWECAKKIVLNKEDGGLDTVAYCEIFGYGIGFGKILKTFTASEAIEKIRQYEQEKEEKNLDEIEDVLKTTIKECGCSLDEIAEVLRKMRKTE